MMIIVNLKCNIFYHLFNNLNNHQFQKQTVVASNKYHIKILEMKMTQIIQANIALCHQSPMQQQFGYLKSKV